MSLPKSHNDSSSPREGIGPLGWIGAALMVGAWLASMGSDPDQKTAVPKPDVAHTQAPRTHRRAQPVRPDHEDELPELEWADIPARRVALYEHVAYYNGIGVRVYRVPAFRLMKTEVTNAQFSACVRAGGCDTPGSFPPNRFGVHDLIGNVARLTP